MTAWLFCSLCCRDKDGRQQYRYEVVYRREESLYSGPDYLESLPGGRVSLQHPLRQKTPPSLKRRRSHRAIEYREAVGPDGFVKPPLATPSGAESLARQNRVNHFLTTLHNPRFPRPINPQQVGVKFPHPAFPGWRSATFIPPPEHHRFFPPSPPSRDYLQHARSAPLLALSNQDPSRVIRFSSPTSLSFENETEASPPGGLRFSPGVHISPIEKDVSQQSPSRDNSRDHSVASSGANSTKPLLPRGRFAPRPLVLPIRPPFHTPFRPPPLGPRSPHTPLSPGPPAYPLAFGPSNRSFQPGSLNFDLRQYLGTRFPKGQRDHELQNCIRDNVYLRTVPVTTRQPRPGEVNGVDYTFLSAEEFEALQRSGSLLEAGVFEGNHYGTPKPPSYGGEGSLRGSGGGGHPLLPGAHPSSEGKRRRNRSNVEAMAATAIDVQAPSGNPPPEIAEGVRLSAEGGPDDLGPLPPNWEKAFTENGEPYFIDHVAGTSSWLDPRLARVQKRTASECGDHELPFGWERIDDPQYGTYYIDHVNRKTQYENPVQVAKGATDNTQEEEESIATYPRMKKEYEPTPIQNNSEIQPNPIPKHHHKSESKRSHSRSGSSAFTRNPSELQGEFLSTTLIKSSRGLGFTIVGGDDNEEEFLQIKSVVPNGPAWQDGHLRTADVLVYVNDTCVLGYTHADVVTMFQNIDPGHTVHLEVCRGYALPFDPNDPNTDIVTTVAVTSSDSRSAKSLFADEYDRSRNNSSAESMNTAKSMPDLSNTERIQVPRPGSADLLSSENFDGHGPDLLDLYPSSGHPGTSSGPASPVGGKPEYLSIPIVKGGLGFGFTIADSAHGQKVKKILDRNRCKILAEGDVLVDINSICVKGKSHTEVVQVLKDCPMGQEAMVMVQRGGGSPSKRNAVRKEQPQSPKKILGSGLFRSKTPTADMYSQQEKEVIPNRPKTPIVDTRSRPKTPNYGGDQDVQEVGRIDQHVGHDSRGHYHPYPGSFAYVGGQSADHNPPEPKLNNLSNQLGHMGLNGNSYDNCSPDQFQQNFIHFEGQGQDNMGGNYNYPRDMYGQPYAPPASHSCEYDKGFSEPVHSYSQQHNYYNNNSIEQQPIINSNGFNDGPFLENMQYGGYYHKDSLDIPRQDSGYSSQAQIPPSRNPYPPFIGQNSSVGYGSGGGSQLPQNSNSYFNHQSDMQRRKESTSFEMEHPAPVPTLRESRGPSNSGMRGHSNGLPIQQPPPHPHEFTVTLHRQETGFGFRIVGGTEEGSQVSIGHIVPGGAADLDHSIMSGDEIVGVDGERVLGSSHHRVVTLMAAASSQGRVILTLRRPATIQRNSHTSNELNRSMEVQYPYDITVTRREHEGFGFVIISSVAKAGSTIGRIIEGSPAERCGRLHIGDRILRVNAVDIKSLHHGSIVNLIKESGYTVTLTIGPPRDDASSTTSNSQQADSDTGDEPELLHVELARGNRGFGFSIRGGKEFHSMPLFVLRIAENGPAAQDGKLKVGDQLVEINGISTRDMTHADAIELIKQCGSSVLLIVRRGAKIQSQFDALSNATLGSPVGPPPPGTHIRSTATLPSGSPGHSQMPYSQSGASLQYGYPGQFSQQHTFHRSSSQPMHSSPAIPHQVYPSHVTNGPLGQSSPRLLGPNETYYWNRMQDHRAN